MQENMYIKYRAKSKERILSVRIERIHDVNAVHSRGRGRQRRSKEGIGWDQQVERVHRRTIMRCLLVGKRVKYKRPRRRSRRGRGIRERGRGGGLRAGPILRKGLEEAVDLHVVQVLLAVGIFGEQHRIFGHQRGVGGRVRLADGRDARRALRAAPGTAGPAGHRGGTLGRHAEPHGGQRRRAGDT